MASDQVSIHPLSHQRGLDLGIHRASLLCYIICGKKEISTYRNRKENHPLGKPGLQELEIIFVGPMGVGTTGRRVDRFLGRSIEKTWEMTEYEANLKRGLKVQCTFLGETYFG